MTTAAYRLIKAALPTAYLTVLSGPWAADVPRHCPAVDRVLTCHFPGFDRIERTVAVKGRCTESATSWDAAPQFREKIPAGGVMSSRATPIKPAKLGWITGGGAGRATGFAEHAASARHSRVARAGRNQPQSFEAVFIGAVSPR